MSLQLLHLLSPIRLPNPQDPQGSWLPSPLALHSSARHTSISRAATNLRNSRHLSPDGHYINICSHWYNICKLDPLTVQACQFDLLTRVPHESKNFNLSFFIHSRFSQTIAAQDITQTAAYRITAT